MQDSAPGWTRYIEDLETQAARLPRRHRPERARPGGVLAAVRAGAARLLARLRAGRGRREAARRPEIDG